MRFLREFNDEQIVENGNTSLFKDIEILTSTLHDLRDLGFKKTSFSWNRFTPKEDFYIKVKGIIHGRDISLEEARKYISDNIDLRLNTISFEMDCMLEVENNNNIENEVNDIIEEMRGRIIENGSRINHLKNEVNKKSVTIFTKGDYQETQKISINIHILIDNYKANRYETLKKV